MSQKVRKKSNKKLHARQRVKRKVRARISGTSERPRLTLFRSNQHIYAQVVDDVKGVTLAAASTNEADLRGKSGSNALGNIQSAKTVGELIAKRSIAKKIEKVVFDRNGFIYHGKVRALADGARESGLKF